MRTANQIQAHAATLFAQLGETEYQIRRLTDRRDALVKQLDQVDTEMGWVRAPMPVMPEQSARPVTDAPAPPAAFVSGVESITEPAKPVRSGSDRMKAALEGLPPIVVDDGKPELTLVNDPHAEERARVAAAEETPHP